ncbi:MAG: cyclic nucleotide-binding protein [Betaproteobacteria bacterium HGW-Betaproteobacteria-8]|nr:MAG: cyclic nucleotide-binding protein [Betaproteobacteria bacterium HGW-Betaproteobacteria-8]
MAIKFHRVKSLGSHPAIARPREAYAKHRYSTPLFVLHETLAAFKLHNGLSMSASLSFYAMLALIPMALLMFFVLSHLIFTSDYAIVKLAILTSNLVPKLSNRIMIEVYNASQQKAVWGAFGLLALFWVVTPLAGAMRSAFYTMASMLETPSYIKRKIKDSIAVLGILLIFFLFSISGLMLEKIVDFIKPAASYTEIINTLGSFALTTLCVAAFYRITFPAKTSFIHIMIGSALIAMLWLAMRPAFALFLSVNQSYGSMFGGMKNLFISIGWLYYTFAVFMIGTELISILRKKEVLLLRGLFTQMPDDSKHYLRELMKRYGRKLKQGEFFFRQGDDDHDIFYVVSGHIKLVTNGNLLREMEAGDYFGEMAFLTDTPRFADAVVASKAAEVVVISSNNIETLMMDDPKVAMNFLREMATRLQASQQQNIPSASHQS